MSDIKKTDKFHRDGTITRDGKRYGCHVDAHAGYPIDGCAAMDESPSMCDYGFTKSGARRSRWTCKFWRKIKE